MKYQKYLIFLLTFTVVFGLLIAFIYKEPKKAQAIFLPEMFEKPNQDLLDLSIINLEFNRAVEFTDSREVLLEIIVGPKVKGLAFADGRDFSRSIIEKLEKLEVIDSVYQKKWLLPAEFGEYEVCAKAYTRFGQRSKTFCNTIQHVERLPFELLKEKLATQREIERKKKEAEIGRKRAIKVLQEIILMLPVWVLEKLPPEVLEGLPQETLEKLAQKLSD